MKKLLILALISTSTLLSTNSYSQSIVMINGQVTEVVLNGNDIEKIVNTQINDYLKDFDQLPERNFQYAKLRSNKPEAGIPSIDSKESKNDTDPLLVADTNSILDLKINK